LLQNPNQDAVAGQLSPIMNLSIPQQPALQLIYDTAPIGLACLSPDCRYLQINQRLTEICGISVEDHLGRSVRECVPALAEAVEGIVRAIMETGEPVTGIEVAGQRAGETDERSWITYWHPLRAPTGEIVAINVVAEEITERKRAEEHQKLLAAELDHRVKNILAQVAAVAKSTRQGSRSIDEFLQSLDGRIGSMATAHGLLSESHWQGVGLAALVRSQLAPYATDANMTIGGTDVILAAAEIQAMAMVLHELVTNAAKYGALSALDGRVSVSWDRRPNGSAGENLVLVWREVGGPPVTAKVPSGYGTTLIRNLVPHELGGKVDVVFPPEGVSCRIEIPLSRSEQR
jgi:PAS domain S-box-containing protein